MLTELKHVYLCNGKFLTYITFLSSTACHWILISVLRSQNLDYHYVCRSPSLRLKTILFLSFCLFVLSEFFFFFCIWLMFSEKKFMSVLCVLRFVCDSFNAVFHPMLLKWLMLNWFEMCSIQNKPVQFDAYLNE